MKMHIKIFVPFNKLETITHPIALIETSTRFHFLVYFKFGASFQRNCAGFMKVHDCIEAEVSMK